MEPPVVETVVGLLFGVATLGGLGRQLALGAAGNAAFEALKTVGGTALAQVSLRRFALPENHDAARAIRRSQLEALQHVLTACESALHSQGSQQD